MTKLVYFIYKKTGLIYTFSHLNRINLMNMI